MIQIGIDDNRLFFTVKKNNQEVIQKSSLGLVIDGDDIGQNVSITGKTKEIIIKEKYPLMGNHARAIILSDKKDVLNAFDRKVTNVEKTDNINIELRPGGGYFMRLQK